MDPISDILEALRNGEMIVLADDESRENEGDLVVAAQFLTPEIVSFMLRRAAGMMCVALSPAICQRLHLDPQTTVNTSSRSTAYTVSVDAHERFGVTTGVSAQDRVTTIRLLADPNTQPGDLVRPGHIHPLRAREGGTLVRAGQTEGSVDLCRLAGLEQAAVIIEVMKDDGTMARRPDLERLCAEENLRMCTVADVIEHRLTREVLVERVDEAPIETPAGPFRLIAYESKVDPMPHVALVKGDVGQRDANGITMDIDHPVLVRMHSQNLLGDVFGDITKPSGKALETAMHQIQTEGCGAIVYLRHEGMGSGLLKRLQSLRETSSDGEARPLPVTSQNEPGLRPPTRKQDYGIGSQILRDLGIRRMRLLTDHPFTPTALSGFGLAIEGFVPLLKP
ncbi:3,4-dihydroxy-2-butanone-4-phosphate synthase [Mucisphaera calidilacus]|uniref:3,4-dihydroxy-2-butanone 4-phosphate synthase n=1 Tax=Mucisphaera calidilacus TaxID=2527982 RepID=A0A518BZY8_9BACT|nr:3,4-dihydroxy-2-butanone-4-phosphate synthase [Mucisphaera calidilacus]QDU72535.1 Riboflavin biosynthesis protein RibBA [Mucisphaera calidilacus]